MPEFPRTAPVTVVAELPAGDLEIVAEECSHAVVDVQPYDASDASREQAAQTRVELTGDTLSVIAPDHALGGMFRFRSGGVRVRVRVPLDSGARIRTASADTRIRGRYTDLAVESASGDIEVDHATGNATLQTASGDVRVTRVDGRLEVKGASGGLTARQIGGPVKARFASGDVEIADAGDGVEVKTASGDVLLGLTRQGRVRIGTASGDVGIGVRPGTGVWLDLSTISGSTRNGLDMTGPDVAPDGPRLNLEVRTVSGDIDVHRVA
ncbi:DUF4097 family beta strand repeat-containing protein [Plantactinospora soyae]|uniref:DUF4097 and DUF4098 domain-containing protein YvlB n=1 Tax=Plantactinospora soyae TaxID=1544732 RepID=A0A927M586_9ACTN|nr:DUF4097 family beta strand repeat-containing protein [Plantactinospora soyae]MBE1487939.1 DUF4097 and DUF4098 domain-containing protein YvlB [Plantactinospora soyae]